MIKTLKNTFKTQLKKLAEQDASPSSALLIFANNLFIKDKGIRENLLPKIEEFIDQDSLNTDAQILHDLGNIDEQLRPEKLIQTRDINQDWRLQLNHIRLCRPEREAQETDSAIYENYDAREFNFTEIAGESYYETMYKRRQITFFYNKYPFGPYHSSIVPRLNSQHPQFMDYSDHNLAWELAQDLCREEHSYIAYNAHGAYASINQLHFQFITGTKLSVFDDKWQHNGGEEPYPANVISHTNQEAVWEQIDALQEQRQPFNILYNGEKALIFVRKLQGTEKSPEWSTGFAWLELGGYFIVTNRTSFEELTDKQIRRMLAAVSDRI